MRKLMWFTLGGTAAAATAVYILQPQQIGNWIAVCAVLFAVTLVISLLSRSLKVLPPFFLGAVALLSWVLVFHTHYLTPIQTMDGNTVDLTVTLSDYSASTDYGIRVEGYTQLAGKTYRVVAYVNEDLQLKPGDTLIGPFRLRSTVGGKEEETYHRGNGIFLLAYPKGEIYHRVAPQIPWFGYPAYMASCIRDLVHKTFPADTLGFAQALLLGDTSLIDYETDTAFKLSGIRHVIAVSGLHVSILFGLVYYVTGRKKWLSAILGLPVLLLFAAMAGFTPSITRACIMHALMILGTLFDREYDPPTALAFAVLCMLIANPYGVCAVSLQLSAGCMCGIFLFSNRIKGWFMEKRHWDRYKGLRARLANWLSGSVSVSVSATLITTPLCALYFGCVSLVGILTNLLTLWLITFIFYGILLVCATAMLWLPLGSMIAWFVSWPMRFVLWVSRVIAKFPLAAVYTVSTYIVAFLVIAYVLLAIFLFMKRKRPLPLICCLVISLSLALCASWAEPLTDDLRMTVLDVGQGQCILLQSEGKTFLVDCGGDSDTAAADTAANTLLSMGVFRLDGVILTHYDRDHAGGAANLLTRVDVDCLYLPDCADSDGYSQELLSRDNVVLVSKDTVIKFGSASISLITTDYGVTNNESGLCVLFQRENCDILITGDRNSYGERDLLRHIQLPDLEVLIVGHHGSKTSTCMELLEAGRPDIAIISVGDNNYGHPTQEVLNRLEGFGCEIYRTDLMGTVIYRG